jgi:hypothetical protein
MPAVAVGRIDLVRMRDLAADQRCGFEVIRLL